jgi:hypothetical protein
MAAPTIQILSDGQKNCAVKVTGIDFREYRWTKVIDVAQFKGGHSKLKIDHVEWAITAGIEVFLAWHAVEGERELILPLGGRGQINFSDYGGLSNLSEGKSGHIELLVQPRGAVVPKILDAFVLFIDMQKQ